MKIKTKYHIFKKDQGLKWFKKAKTIFLRKDQNEFLIQDKGYKLYLNLILISNERVF